MFAAIHGCQIVCISMLLRDCIGETDRELSSYRAGSVFRPSECEGYTDATTASRRFYENVLLVDITTSGSRKKMFDMLMTRVHRGMQLRQPL